MRFKYSTLGTQKWASNPDVVSFSLDSDPEVKLFFIISHESFQGKVIVRLALQTNSRLRAEENNKLPVRPVDVRAEHRNGEQVYVGC